MSTLFCYLEIRARGVDPLMKVDSRWQPTRWHLRSKGRSSNLSLGCLGITELFGCITGIHRVQVACCCLESCVVQLLQGWTVLSTSLNLIPIPSQESVLISSANLSSPILCCESAFSNEQVDMYLQTRRLLIDRCGLKLQWFAFLPLLPNITPRCILKKNRSNSCGFTHFDFSGHWRLSCLPRVHKLRHVTCSEVWLQADKQ